jgi:hypothetical protein
VTPADGIGRDHAAGIDDSSLARARVGVGLSLSLSLENVPRGKRLGGEEGARVEYRWPPVSQLEERDLSVAYEALTGRRVWRGVLPLLILARRRHGPDTLSLLRELYQEGGVQDLLARLRAYPPRHDPHPNYVASTLVPAEADPQGPAGPSSSELGRAEHEHGTDQVTPGGPPATPKGRERMPDRLRGGFVLISHGVGEKIVPEVPRLSLPDSTRRDAGPGDCGCDEADLLPGLIYCATHRPPFDSNSHRRYDRRSSNPAAALFLSEADYPSAAGALRP